MNDQSPKAQYWVDKMYLVQTVRDRDAFAAIFAHYAPRVKSFLIKSGASEDEAEDCAQDTMVTIWHKAESFDPSRANLSTWIFTIARNRRIDRLRKTARPEPEELDWGPDGAPMPEEVIAIQEEFEKLNEFVSNLPKKQKIIVEKAYFNDLTHSEIAAETGLPLGTIKSRLRLALSRLRASMKKEQE